MDAVGYDPHVPFGFPDVPTDLFMVVTVIFVRNVLPTVDARLEVLRAAAARLTPDGMLIVAKRSSAAIRRAAARSRWRPCGDGFISHERRGTFRHGMDTEELSSLGEMVGLRAQGSLSDAVGSSSGARYERVVPAFGELDQIDAIAERIGKVGHSPVVVVDDVAVQNTTCSQGAVNRRLEVLDDEVKVYRRPVANVVSAQRRHARCELRLGRASRWIGMRAPVSSTQRGVNRRNSCSPSPLT